MTLTEATELTGKSKSTLTRAIRTGKLAAKRSEDGKTYEVDPAELARAFPFATTHQVSPNDEPQDSPADPNPGRVVELLEQQNDDMKQTHRRELDQLQAQIDDLRKDRDDWKTQCSNQTLLLKHEQEQGVKGQGSFLARLFT